MFTVSETAIQAALRDIRNGVTYPDFWEGRYEDKPEVEQTEDTEKEEEKQAVKA